MDAGPLRSFAGRRPGRGKREPIHGAGGNGYRKSGLRHSGIWPSRRDARGRGLLAGGYGGGYGGRYGTAGAHRARRTRIAHTAVRRCAPEAPVAAIIAAGAGVPWPAGASRRHPRGLPGRKRIGAAAAAGSGLAEDRGPDGRIGDTGPGDGRAGRPPREAEHETGRIRSVGRSEPGTGRARRLRAVVRAGRSPGHGDRHSHEPVAPAARAARPRRWKHELRGRQPALLRVVLTLQAVRGGGDGTA